MQGHVLKALLFTDIVSSTRLSETLGDARWSALCARLDERARLLRPASSVLLERTDGFLIAFDRPAEALRYALAWHAALRDATQSEGVELACRAGIHLGEVLLRSNPEIAVAGGERPIEMDGLAIAQAARVMSLGSGGQTLLTREAFNIARRAAVGDDAFPQEVKWMAHGPYLLKGVEEPVDIFEAGIPGEAPLAPPADTEKARRAVVPGDDVVLGWRPAAGLPVPGREKCVLDRQLGVGGFGEVWLATHSKTREPSVFKFCFEAARLRGLKREVTLFRLLKETLGDRPDIARVLDWNFEEAPFWLESEYTPGGDLHQWAEAQGGLPGVPLATRLEIIAQSADALSAAHSVGVLHKDVKPSNLLVHADKDGTPRAKLTDFGIGIITDRARLADVGLSTTGLTDSQLTANDSSRSGTRLYVAPELIEGKPATIQSDIYALGVMLYQVSVGDMRRALSSDWREDITDELLLEDIADCVAGDRGKRLRDAGQLAQRVRSLEVRREERGRLAHEREEAEAARRVLERATRRRRILSATAAVTVVILAALTTLYIRAEGARQEAEEKTRWAEAARAEAEDLIGFMLTDLRGGLEPIGRLDVLDSVLAKVDRLLDERSKRGLTTSERTSQLDLFLQIAEVRIAQGNLEEAGRVVRRSLAEAIAMAASEPDAPQWRRAQSVAWNRLADILKAQGDLPGALEALQHDVAIARKLAEDEPGSPDARRFLAASLQGHGAVLQAQGKMAEAGAVVLENLAIIESLTAADPASLDDQRRLGLAWNRVGGFHEAKAETAQALAAFEKHRDIAVRLVEADPANAQWRRDLAAAWNRLGNMYEALGRAEDAFAAFSSSLAEFEYLANFDPTNAGWLCDFSTGLKMVGMSLRVLGRSEEARAALEKALEVSTALVAMEPQNAAWQRELAVSWSRLGLVLVDQGKTEEAEAAFRENIAVLAPLTESDPTNVDWKNELSLGWHSLAGLLEKRGDLDGALVAFQEDLALAESLVAANPNDIMSRYGLGATVRRIGGVYEAQGRLAEALVAHERAVELMEGALGPDHAESLRSRESRDRAAAALASEGTAQP